MNMHNALMSRFFVIFLVGVWGVSLAQASAIVPYSCVIKNSVKTSSYSVVKTTGGAGAGSFLTGFYPPFLNLDNIISSTQPLSESEKAKILSVLNVALYQQIQVNISTFANQLSYRLSYNSVTNNTSYTSVYASGGWKGTASSAGCVSTNCYQVTVPALTSVTTVFIGVDNITYSFAGGSALVNSTLDLPLPPQEYAPQEIIATAAFTRMLINTSEYINLTAGGFPGLQTNAPQGVLPTITCTRPATALTLTLNNGNSAINFGSIQTGITTPVTRELNWSASGTGQASIWTMTFDVGADKKDNDNILLGNARVKVFDVAGIQVPLGTPVNISGVTGKYTFELDPTGATPGTPSADVNVTLTAN